MHKGVFLIITLFLPLSPLFALTVTEVMTDPDSQPDFRLEWVELYNNTSSPLAMDNWSVNGAPFSMTLDAYSCGVIVRQAEGEDSFATVYGNRNGIWGDVPEEEYPCVEASLSLVNGGGSLIITDSSGTAVLEQAYPSDGGETEDNTIRLYSRGVWEYGAAPWGTPGEPHVMIALDFSDSAVKEGTLYREGEAVLREACTGLWTVIGLETGLSYRVEVSFDGDLLYSRALLLREDFCEDVELELPDPLPVTFQLSDSEGLPVEQAEITIVSEGTQVFSDTVTDSSSVDLYPGTYAIYAFAEEFIGRYQEFAVSEPGEASLSFPCPDSILISEIAPFGETEWIEIRSLSPGEVTLRGMSLGDNAGTEPLGVPRVHFSGYLVLTEDLETFESLWGDDLPVTVISSFPSLNDTGDMLSLFLEEAVCDRVDYGTDWYSGEQPGSFERIMPLGPSSRENFFNSNNPTPGMVNRVDGMLNGERRIILREISPFTEEEYVECLVLEDGTEGRGALFYDYTVTDLDTDAAFQKKILTPGESLVIRELSLGSRGDQVCLRNGETVVAAFSWREKYTEMSPDEKEDFASLEAAGISPVLFDEPDPTLSFHYHEGTWILDKATPGTGEEALKRLRLALPEAVSMEEGALSLMYSLDCITEVTVFLFDTAGFRLLTKDLLLWGEGSVSLDIPHKRGRYIFIADYRRGEEKGQARQTFIVY